MGEFVNINQDELNVKYGLLNIREERDSARHSLRYIVGDVKDLKHGYIKLGFHLAEFQKFKYYEDFGYDNFYDFCTANLAIEKSAVSRLISVWSDFSAVNSDNTHLMVIDEKYVDYNYNQLVEMLSLNKEQRSKISPDMTIKQIRDYKKGLKAEKTVPSVATSQQEEKEIVIEKSFDDLVKSGEFVADVLQLVDGYLHKRNIAFTASMNNKNLFLTSEGKKYRMTLFCLKEK